MNIHDSDIRREALKEGISQGAELTKIETAKKMIQKNIPDETIAECTGISLEKILELKQTIKK